MALKTDYKSAEYTGMRKYRQVTNDDGTVSFIDVTDYAVVGSEFGGEDINATNTEVNKAKGFNPTLDETGKITGYKTEASGETEFPFAEMPSEATITTAGLMSASDYTKLLGIEAFAQANVGNPVYISATAPTDTTGVWVVPPT